MRSPVDLDGDIERKKLAGEYVALVAAYLHRNFHDLGLRIFPQAALGMSIIGKKRVVDLLLTNGERGASSRALVLECKFQVAGGTADEKIPYALDDIATLRTPGCVVYAGSGFSRGVVHLLQGSPHAAYCLPDPESLEPVGAPQTTNTFAPSTWELDHILAATFGWWHLVTRTEFIGPPPGGNSLWPNLERHVLQTRKGPHRAPRQTATKGPR